MGFGNLSTPAGLESLNAFLVDKTYIEGEKPTQADVIVYKAVGSSPDSTKFANAARWYTHIASYESEFSSLPGDKTVSLESLGPAGGAAAAEDDDDVDLFGSDDEEADAEAEKLKQERLAQYAAKKAAKGPKPAAKSIVTLDVKPWDDETDLDAMLEAVKGIEMGGLTWGGHQFIAVGFGIKKLQINAVVVDEEVSIDDLQEQITDFEDYVQSVDVAAMQKL